jgi:YesN/AraC family two-component response regulator
VIILSNYGEKDLVQRGMTLGALEFLVKADTTPSQLLGGMREWLAE